MESKKSTFITIGLSGLSIILVAFFIFLIPKKVTGKTPSRMVCEWSDVGSNEMMICTDSKTNNICYLHGLSLSCVQSK